MVSRFTTRLLDLFFRPRPPEPYVRPARSWLVLLLFVPVMLVFPGIAVLTALLGLADLLAGHQVDPLGDYSLVGALAQAVYSAIPIAMAGGFLRATGDRLARLGLAARPAGEIASATWWAFAWIFVLGGLFELGGALLLGAIPGLHHYLPAATGSPHVSVARLVAVGLPAAVGAGLVEEIVVVGYAYRVLERVGVSDGWIVAALVALRLSYHLYYGLGTLVLLPWAYVSVIFYRRYRRLWPLIVGHALWDTYAILSSASNPAQLAGLVYTIYIMIAAIVVAVLRWLDVRREPLASLALPRPATDPPRRLDRWAGWTGPPSGGPTTDPVGPTPNWPPSRAGAPDPGGYGPTGPPAR